jgi:hypothetical protein
MINKLTTSRDHRFAHICSLVRARVPVDQQDRKKEC